eukprot:5376760-Pyramimonas_sp.AAC.1
MLARIFRFPHCGLTRSAWHPMGPWGGPKTPPIQVLSLAARVRAAAAIFCLGEFATAGWS